MTANDSSFCLETRAIAFKFLRYPPVRQNTLPLRRHTSAVGLSPTIRGIAVNPPVALLRHLE